MGTGPLGSEEVALGDQARQGRVDVVTVVDEVRQRVDAAAMHAAGYEFFRSGSVWLTVAVPPGYLTGHAPAV